MANNVLRIVWISTQDFFFGAAGTFLPFSLASESPMAIACLREVTFLPLRPLLSVPAFSLWTARSTSLLADLLYLRGMVG